MKSILLILILPSFLFAQDFDEEIPDLELFRSIGLSGTFHNFEPQSSNSVHDSVRLRTMQPMYFLEFRQQGFRIALGYTRYMLENRERSGYEIAVENAIDLSLSKSRERGLFYLPLFITTDFYQTDLPSSAPKEFNVASVGVGGGIKFKLHTTSIAIDLLAAGIVHYCNSGFSYDHGTGTSYIAQIIVVLPESIGEGMVFGYRYQQRQWKMNDVTLNYARTYHGPFLGICF